MARLHDYGPLLLASRLRRISEAMHAGVDEVYASLGVQLSSRCFPILFLLRDHGRMGISQLAGQLGQSHPAVSQMSRRLLQAGVVREHPDPADSRRRLLGLSPRGNALMQRLAPAWQAIEAAVAGLEAGQQLSAALTSIDAELARKPFAQRIGAQLHDADAAAVEVIPYEPRYRADFKRLNIEWLERYFRVEPIDVTVLSNPAAIVRKGGFILLARLRGGIIGTCAVMHDSGERYELTKMSVTARYQGLKIGRRMLVAALEAFAARGKGELFLETNSVLKPAIALYESVGFVHAPRPGGPSHYERADVYMDWRPSVAPAGAATAAARVSSSAGSRSGTSRTRSRG